MISEVTMYTVICDNCNKDAGSESEYSCWNDQNYALENAKEDDWIELDDKHYCTDCYYYDEEDILQIKSK